MKYEISKEFEALIGQERLAGLNKHPSSVYGVDSKFRISYLNPAWFTFAEENGSQIFQSDRWSLGSNIFDTIPDVQQSFYKNIFESVLQQDESQTISEQTEYECSSQELYRRYSMHLYPLRGAGIVVVHSLLVEEPHSKSSSAGPPALDEDDYIDANGILHQCANCRRVKNIRAPEQWDWVPKFVESPHLQISHGVCAPCMEHYYLSSIRSRAKN